MCKDWIESRWIVGGSFKASRKKFGRYDAIIPGIRVKIISDLCDIEGWTMRLWFESPNQSKEQPRIYLDRVITSNTAEFPLQGTMFGVNGVWKVTGTLKGPTGESRDTVDFISYEVGETAEGLEIPPIAPEETTNTVDELIKLLNEKIEEGDTANNDWNVTIQTGNTANDDWILTISAGDDAQSEWQLTINSGNTLNATMLETINNGNLANTEWSNTITAGGLLNVILENNISDGSILDAKLTQQIIDATNISQIIEGQIQDGDLIQKGAGFDNVKYPNAKAITNTVESNTEQIQNCLQQLDESLVAVISPKGISSNVVGTNVINVGSNVIEGDGISFVKDSDGFGIGEGYENLWKKGLVKADSARTTSEWASNNVLKITANQDDISGNYISINIPTSGLQLGTTYTLTYKIIRGFEHFKNIYTHTNTFTENVSKSTVEGTLTATTLAASTSGLGIMITLDNATTTTGDLIEIEAILTPTANKVPFVPHSFLGGELKMKEAHTLDKYSHIICGYHNGGTRYMPLTFGHSTGYERFQTESTIPKQKYYTLLSRSSKTCIGEDGIEYPISARSEGSVRETSYVGIPAYEVGALYSSFIFHGDLTKEELKEQLEIIKSNNYNLPPNMQGTIFPVGGMVRRSDNYGVLNDTIKTDTNRDLWYVDAPALYSVIDSTTGAESNVIVQDDLSITGTSMEDVSGRLRVKANSFVRKVK